MYFMKIVSCFTFSMFSLTLYYSLTMLYRKQSIMNLQLKSTNETIVVDCFLFCLRTCWITGRFIDVQRDDNQRFSLNNEIDITCMIYSWYFRLKAFHLVFSPSGRCFGSLQEAFIIFKALQVTWKSFGVGNFIVQILFEILRAVFL